MEILKMGNIKKEKDRIIISDCDDSNIEWVKIYHNDMELLIAVNNVINNVSWIDLIKNELLFGGTVISLGGCNYEILSPNEEMYDMCLNNKNEWSYLNTYHERYLHKIKLKNGTSTGSCFMWEDYNQIGFRPILKKV